MNRATGERSWLGSGDPPTAFLLGLAGACAVPPVELHAYCLLPRHYHLLVRAEPAPFFSALARLEAASGFPAHDAARAVPVALGRHLMIVSRYVHLNPVDAGLAWRPEHWPFSSFRAYLGALDAPRFVVTEALLGRFGSIGARHRHRAFVYAGMDPGTRDGDGRPHWSALFGSGSLAEDQAWRIEPVLGSEPLSLPLSGSVTPLHRLARAIASEFEIACSALRSARVGGASAALARGALVYAARAQGDHRLRDVAAFMGYASPATAAAAAERFDRALRLDPRLSDRFGAALSSKTSF